MPKQTTDINGNPIGLQYTAPNQKWTIVKGVEVTGTVVGVYSPFANSKLINQGEVGGGTYGVWFSLSSQFGNYLIDNQAKATITGGEIGIYVQNFLGSLEINNAGKANGAVAGIAAVGSTDVEVTNTGSITGGQYGLYLAAGAAGADGSVVHNYGKIQSPLYATFFAGPPGVPLKLINHEDGTIKGGSALAVYSTAQINIKNEGTMQGYVVTSEYADKLVNKGKIKGETYLGGGDDIFKNKGDAKAGNLHTAQGNDLVVLSNASEKLVFDTALNAATNVDTIKKFASGKDMMLLDEDIFTTIMPGTLSSSAFHKGTSAADADDRIIYDKSTGALYYDPDGIGGIAQTQFAKLTPGTKLKASDFSVGDYSIGL
jgi:Ca2+-binding RTX toxin-like protein